MTWRRSLPLTSFVVCATRWCMKEWKKRQFYKKRLVNLSGISALHTPAITAIVAKPRPNAADSPIVSASGWHAC